MTHPTLTPRGTDRADLAPAPIELQPRGGCMGVTGRIVKVLVGECLACSRLDVGGPQITPRYERKGCGIDCQDVVHGATVLPIDSAEQAAERGGACTSGNKAPGRGAP